LEANKKVDQLAGNEWLDIFNKIVKGGHNDKAKLEGNHWSSTTLPGLPDMRGSGISTTATGTRPISAPMRVCALSGTSRSFRDHESDAGH
jgi:hypothetical protein